ncbi:ferredoxin family protein [uncultured Mailhella sp.]|uniref:4Fe-4S dicluster domain-containing protein n=1 Tax=uncultured Mailhella sp. TaxID=1981031 RepID=UPI002618D3AE|nr:ferredoxin family protein [uncultured Mailhella sp.]
MPPIIDRNKCVGCGTCVDICNSNIFVFDRSVDTVPRVKFPDECWHCDSCVIDCPKGAVTLRIPLAYMLLHVDADTLKPREAK